MHTPLNSRGFHSKMKLITDKQFEAVDNCLTYNIPFALFTLPGHKECRFFASRPDKDGECHAFADDDNIKADGCDTFFISRFNADEPYVAGIRPEYDENTLSDLIAELKDIYPASDVRPLRMSTRRESYSAAFIKMRHRLRTHGGKVVLSRHESIFSTRYITEVVDEYIASAPDTFRYFCYTPETGLWFGATPELLLSADAAGNTFRTMALAGTQSAGSDADWDDKNLLEHRYVADYITHSLSNLGLTVDASPMEELYTGAVKHLCTPISATGHADPIEVIDTLSPTPAVAGIPVDVAIAEIDTLESHRRQCYAGVVGVRIDNCIYAFVNLRCAFAAFGVFGTDGGWIYNLYAGGGIMPDSVEEDEWKETADKTAVLSSIITDCNPSMTRVYDLRDGEFIQYQGSKA